MTSTTPSMAPAAAATAPASQPARLMIDAPARAFHWLFALSFAGAWITAESERWRGLHVTLGYAFGGLLLFRLVYGLVGPRQARLASLWHRVSGFGDWLRNARAGRIDPPRAVTLGMGAAMLLLISVAAPLVLSGYVGYVDWLGMEDAMEEVHEFFANSAMALVAAHLALIALLSMLRRRNLATPMWTGRAPGAGPDLVKANRAWLAVLMLAAYAGFVGWQTVQSDPGVTPATQGERRGGHHADD
ncbi:cytochrome b/b6 domain-containing protein [Roseateles cellulosilyticus]|uniref:Cytochrome b/b6 domain-containing protein n=1 Tax=Pelomonas cellulosilytica TaxID=2906762 RepID=A0ABS8Y0E6_9BURK|nr:cytochrome b/b6 domain-containing protein [Pelomonas sp. P8]MCE4557723.1 cytochrome b/b6 domain-containing protein [Pelomonas sp. P8]